MQPYSPDGSKASTSRRSNRIASATPAFAAFARARSRTLPSRSDAAMSTGSPRRSAARASSRAPRHASRGTNGQASAANDRLMPGAIARPSSAASIAIVPDPQRGSANGRDGCQRLSSTSAAARFSRSGASPAPVR